MRSLHLTFLAVVSLPLAGCGGDDGVIIPEGAHHQYVASKILVPLDRNQGTELGLDLDGDKRVDNQLSVVLETLASSGFNVQAPIDTAIAQGAIILLGDLQTTDFVDAGATGFRVSVGSAPMPEPCMDPAVPTLATCGRHLTGTGTFSISELSPADALVTGAIVGGTFTGGPGKIPLQLAFGGTNIQLDLIGARAVLSGITADGISSVIVGGAITQSDVDGKILPAMQQQIAQIVTNHCTDLGNPGGNCGCTMGSAGRTVLGLFDTDPVDCAISVAELRDNFLIQSVLKPDVKIGGKDAVSLGVKAEVTKASFPAQ